MTDASQGFQLRPFRSEDLPEIVALINACHRFDSVPEVLEVAEFAEDLQSDGADFDRDTRVAVIDGAIVGMAYTSFLPAEVGQERCYLSGEVSGEFRNRGIGRTLLTWSLERGREQLHSTGRDLPRYIRTDAWDFLEAPHRLYRRFGLTPVRWFEELLRPLVDLPPTPQITGIRIEPWPADPGADATILAVKNRAFRDHWGSAPTTEAAWGRMVRGFAARPDLSLVARTQGGDIVGFALNHRYPEDDELIGRRDAWIQSLGTVREWRGRGIATALIVESMRAFLDEGLTHASIGVDSDNPSGAAQLYRNLGFERVQGSITYELQV